MGQSTLKLSTWARLQGLSYKTAWRLWKAGKLPVPAEQLATGTVIIHAAPANEPPGVALYARVSSGDQKADLDRAAVPFGGVLSRARLSGRGSGAGNGLRLEWLPQSPFANLPQSESAGHRGRASGSADALRV